MSLGALAKLYNPAPKEAQIIANFKKLINFIIFIIIFFNNKNYISKIT